MHHKKGISLIIGTAIISGFSIFINQFGVQVVSSDIFTFLKNLVAGVVVVGVLLLMNEWQAVKKLKMQDYNKLVLIGLIGGSIPFILFFKGLAISFASNGALIHKSMFLFVAVLAVIILKEKPKKNLIIGMLLILIGNVLLLNFNSELFLHKSDLLILGATLLWAMENIISKRALETISPRIVASSRMLFGGAFIVVYLAITGQLNSIMSLNLAQLSWVWLTGIILTGYVLTWYTGLKYINVSTATCLLTLGLPITTGLQLMQGKIFSGVQIIGLIILMAGFSLILFSVWKRKFLYEVV